MNLDPHGNAMNRRQFLARSAKAGASIAVAGAAGFWFHDTQGPDRPGDHHSDLRLPDFSIEDLEAKMSIVRGQDRVGALRLGEQAVCAVTEANDVEAVALGEPVERRLGITRGCLEVLAEYLDGIGIPHGGYQLADGSGMSRGNRMTPRQLTWLLGYLHRRPLGRELIRSLVTLDPTEKAPPPESPEG